MRLPALLLAALLTTVPAGVAPAGAELAVTARSLGYGTRCAEMDNVLVALSGPGVAAFEIRATHPTYLRPELPDWTSPDFTNCDFPQARVWRAPPFSTVLYEDARLLLRGHRLSHSWRPEQVPFAVGNRVVRGLHLVQLVVKDERGSIEVLVLYPADGYWRAKPLPPPGRADTAFGSSFAIGPLSQAHRPLVRLRHVRFEPETLTFRLDFAQGGRGDVQVVSIGRDALALRVTLDPPAGLRPFALFSSMHVAPDNADVARVAVRPPGSGAFSVVPVDRLTEATGAEFRFGRDLPSRHNTSAPDLTFGPFHGH